MTNSSINEVIASFRKSRGQSSEPPKREEEVNRKSRPSAYDRFLKKYADLDRYIDKFRPSDLVFYFHEVASENGYKYAMSMQKDSHIMKRLRETYSNREICGMIEFLYTSDQDYLDKNRLSVNLLGSRWINTIYADTQLWLDDKYVPASVKKSVKSHEWDKSVAEVSDSAKIGVKL